MPAIVDVEGVTRSNAYFIPPEQLQQGDNSRRWDDTDILELALDIVDRGQLVSALVTWGADGSLQIVDGRRRVAAIRYINENNLTEKPLGVRCEQYRGLKGETFAAAVATNIKRKSLSPIDLAHSINRLEVEGKTRKDIAKLLDISEALISQTLKLTTLPADLQRRIHKGEIPASAGYELAGMPKDQRDEAVAAVKQAAKDEGKPEEAAKVTRAAVRKVKQDRAERGEEVSGPVQRSRKEVVNLFTEWAGCEDGTIEEPILKFAKTMTEYMAGKVGDRAILNRLREILES